MTLKLQCTAEKMLCVPFGRGEYLNLKPIQSCHCSACSFLQFKFGAAEGAFGFTTGTTEPEVGDRRAGTRTHEVANRESTGIKMIHFGQVV